MTFKLDKKLLPNVEIVSGLINPHTVVGMCSPRALTAVAVDDGHVFGVWDVRVRTPSAAAAAAAKATGTCGAPRGDSRNEPTPVTSPPERPRSPGAGVRGEATSGNVTEPPPHRSQGGRFFP